MVTGLDGVHPVLAWGIAVVAAGAAAGCAASAGPRRLRSILRTATTEHAAGAEAGAADDGGERRAFRWVVAGGLAGAVWALVGGLLGVTLAAFTGWWGSRWLRTLGDDPGRRRRQRVEADLPVAADLLAACLTSGCTLTDAAAATADAVGGPVGQALRHALRLESLGGHPADCWDTVAAEPGLEPLGEAVARATHTGAPLAQIVEGLAQEGRARRRVLAEAEARALGVRSSAPVGLCFLPAFVVVGVVPVVISIADGAGRVLP
jgi:Flp pilus assembly protein TadB